MWKILLEEFYGDLRAQKTRAFLTMLAVTWGTIAVVLLLSFGEGLKRNFEKGSKGLGEGIIVVWPGTTAKPFRGFPQGRELHFTQEDVELLRASVPIIAHSSPEMRRWGTNVTWGRTTLSKPVVGVEPDYGDMRNQIPEAGGRFLDAIDEREKRHVAFLGDKTKQELFGDVDAIGKTFLVNKESFVVVGVMKHKIQMGTYSGPDENNVVIPLSTFRSMFGRRTLSDFVVKADRPDENKELGAELYRVLGARLGFDPTDKRALSTWDTVESQRITRNISIGIEMFLGVIGALTLLIGGVGVANIMYAVVKERTREIGVKMALGAKRRWIIVPFVLEGLVYTFIGGALGITIATVLVSLTAFIPIDKNQVMSFLGRPTLSPMIGIATSMILGLIGLLAGYFPARRAASVDPAATLRYE